MNGIFVNDRDLQEFLKSRDKACVLFYASWCPFSRAFLPVFEKHARKHGEGFVKLQADDDDSACDRYSVSVYPSVIFFENGKAVRRLDGIAGQGLDEGRLKEWIAACGL